MKITGSILLGLFLCLFASNVAYAAPATVQLTDQEQAFIEEHPVIRLGVDPSFIPYEFIDSDGEYKGIASEYIKLIEERTGLNMVVEKDLTWAQAYEKGVQKELDVLPCVGKTEEREQYFTYSDPYYAFRRVVFLNKDNKDIKSFNDLLDKRIAVQADSSHDSFLKAYDTIEISRYNTVPEAIQALSLGKEIAFVGNQATTSYFIKSEGITNLKFIEIPGEEKQSLYFAVRNDWPELVGIINKGLASITKEEKLNIDNKWIGVEAQADYTFLFQVLITVGAVVGIVFFVSFYWIVKLRKEIALRKKTEEALNVAKEEADHANQVKSNFLARMSHEIRTPLNAIMGMSYLIKKTEVTVTQELYLEKIMMAARNMLGIINDILDFSKIEAGKVELEKISFNLDNVLQQVINVVSVKIEEQGIDFSMNKDVDIPPWFIGDPKRIEQILINVINNAAKFTDHGSVSLAVQISEATGNRYQIEFAVTDTGIGMTEEQIGNLFKSFEQADATISRRFGGTGLGLSIVKSLVDLMGGEINVRSVLEKGSTFSIKIPLEADTSGEKLKRINPSADYFETIRALILDKNEGTLNLLKNYLESFKIDADYAMTETDAFKLLSKAAKEKSKPYNLLIIDYKTPVDEGIEFFNRVKKMQLFETMPKCIILVPFARDDLYEKLEEANIDFGISKPVLPSVLFNGILEIFKIQVLEKKDRSLQDRKKQTPASDYPYRVLIVEDNKTNQFIAKSILEQAGFQISLADNGEEGYKYFVGHLNELDLILMDLHMPVMNGYESAESIRKVDENIPIIAMTADAISGVEEKCKSLGMNHYISKPFEPDQFVETILEVMKTLKTEPQKDMQATDNGDKTEVVQNVLDQQAGLRILGGNEELYKMVLGEYYKENSDTNKNLAAKIQSGEYQEAVQIVHKIKGSSGNIGANRLYETASNLQKALADENIKDISLLTEEFSRILNQLLFEIQKTLAVE